MESKYYEELLEYKNYFIQRTVAQVDTNMSTKPYISMNIDIYLQLVLWRSRRLYESIIESCSDHNFDKLVLCLRAQVELVGAVGYLLANIRKLSTHEISVEDFDDLLNCLLLGSRKANIKSDIVSKNVLTLIQATDKLKLFGDEQKSVLESIYNILSEFCHPNSYSLISTIESIEKGVYKFGYNRFEEKELAILDNAKIVYPLLFDLLDHITKAADEILLSLTKKSEEKES